MKIKDICGTWKYLDKDGRSGDFNLPGSTCENSIGKKQEYYSDLCKEAVRAPRERYEYIAPIYVQREVEIPNDWEGKHITLFLERVNIAPRLWIDETEIERGIIGLSTPHTYNLGKNIHPGKHIIKLCIDNRNLLNIDNMASGYSIDTQGYWNGIIGRIELRCEENTHIDDIQVYPDKTGITVRVVPTSPTYSPTEQNDAEFILSVTPPDGKRHKEAVFNRKLFNSREPVYLRYDITEPQYWNEFNPNLYTLDITYKCLGVTDKKSLKFGMRTVKSENKKLLINDRQISLRGTIDCAQYPLTGYPPMDIDVWRKNFSIVKDYGLNHVRFHAWCPPECAFCAADELGIYISVEMPLWLNHDVCELEFGDDPIHKEYYMNEAFRISDTYGNHPSFIMFSCGNENMGDFASLERIITAIKAYDNRHIYTITSNFDHNILSCEDYLCAFDAGGNHVRLQNMQDKAAIDTCLDYSKAVSEAPVPIISFEVGQYAVYPNVDICEKYNGNIMPTNFDAIRKKMIEKGVYERLNDYIQASGDMAVKLYKEDIEAALRTKDFGGFELLSLIDYTGQSTATVGILDVLYESKGLVSPSDWRGFCDDVVPLFKAKRVFRNTDTLTAELDMYNFGEQTIEKSLYEVRIYQGDEIFYKSDTYDTVINVPLDGISASTKLDVHVTVCGHTNKWRVYVFVQPELKADVKIINTQNELEQIIKTGGRAIVTGGAFEFAMRGSFIPVFWSPVHFPSPNPCGAIIDHNHPIFAAFPTDKYPDYQWKPLMDKSVNMDLSRFQYKVRPIVDIVPNFIEIVAASPLFETTIGNARLLFCGLDLSGDDISTISFRSAIINYISS